MELIQTHPPHPWLRQLRTALENPIAYPCPRCSESIEALVPPAGRVYEGTAYCPRCGCRHYKAVQPDGAVATLLKDGGKSR